MKNFEELKETANLVIIEHSGDGGSGILYQNGKQYGTVVWSFGGGWEHVSVCPFKRRYTPTWEEMCRFKRMFFYPEEVAVQYHPAESEYVNNLPNCLHLWRPLEEKMPTPPSIMVGIKKGQTLEDIKKEINNLIR